MSRPSWRAFVTGVVVLLSLFGLTLIAQLGTHTEPVSASTTSWTQDIHDAQRSGATNDDPAEPWSYAWSFNGPDNKGGSSNHIFDIPIDGRVITGGGMVFEPAGGSGLYALNEATGTVAWHDASTAYNATPAYDPVTGYLLAGGQDGALHEFNGQTGASIGTFSSGSAISKSVMIVGSYAYFVTDAGSLYKVTISGLNAAWAAPYKGGARPGTIPAYSASRNVIVFATDQQSGALVHAVDNASGAAKWVAAPFPSNLTPVADGSHYTYHVSDRSWPVIADRHGVVFIWFDLGDMGESIMTQLPPSSGNYFPAGAVNGPSGTNAVVRSWLQQNPQYQSIYALSLDDGSKAFIPAIGYSGEEWQVPGTSDLAHTFGGMPVVKTWPNGDEVAYSTFRNGSCAATAGADYRWDSQVGEMALDSTTVPGLNAGDLRFVGWGKLGTCYQNNSATSYVWITDEKFFLSMAGSSLFYAHWGSNDSASITNRATSLGMTTSNPIAVTTHDSMLRATNSCATMDVSTHFMQAGCTMYGDTRFWNGPLWWTYYNSPWPPGPAVTNGQLMPYTIVSDGYIIVQGMAGDLMVMKTANAQSTPYQTSLPILK